MKGMNKKTIRSIVGVFMVIVFCSGFALYKGYTKDYSDDVTYRQANHIIETLKQEDQETDFEYWDIQKIEDDLYLVSYAQRQVTDVFKTKHSWILQNDKVIYEVKDRKLLKGKTLDHNIAKKFNHNIQTVFEDVKKEKVDFKTSEVESNRVPKGEKKKFIEGKKGEKEIRSIKSYVNGTLKDNKKTEKILSEVVDEVTLIGTYVAPPPPPPPPPLADVKVEGDISSGRKLTWYNVKFNSDGSIAPWANRMFGSYSFTETGCVPTSLAIAMSGYDVHVSPVQVGEFLYAKKLYNTASYLGTGGKGVEAGIRNYGLGVNGLRSEGAVSAALQRGNVVVGAVQSGRFGVGYGYTHMVVLNGYRNGSTYVIDPTYGNKSSNESISALWAGQSYDVVDRELGYVFYEITGGGYVEETPIEKPAPPETKPEEPKDEYVVLKELKGLSKQEATQYLSSLGIEAVFKETIIETEDITLDKHSIVQTTTLGLKHNKKDKQLTLSINTYKFVEKEVEPEPEVPSED